MKYRTFVVFKAHMVNFIHKKATVSQSLITSDKLIAMFQEIHDDGPLDE